MPSQSNPADLISRGMEPSALPTYTPWRKGPLRSSRSYQAGLQQWCLLLQTIWKLEMYCACCTSTTSRSHYTRTFQVEQLISHYTAAESTTADIPRPTGKHPLCTHKILTRLRLPVRRWYNRFLIQKKGRNGWNNTRLQPPSLSNTTSIHRSGRSSHKGRTITAICTSLSSNTSDDLPPNLRFTRLFVSAEHTRFHHVGPQLTASLHEKFWIPRIRNRQPSSLLNLLQVQGTINTTAHGSYHPLESNPRARSTGIDYLGPISLRMGTPCSKTITKGHIVIFAVL